MLPIENSNTMSLGYIIYFRSLSPLCQSFFDEAKITGNPIDSLALTFFEDGSKCTRCPGRPHLSFTRNIL